MRRPTRYAPVRENGWRYRRMECAAIHDDANALLFKRGLEIVTHGRLFVEFQPRSLHLVYSINIQAYELIRTVL